MCVCVGIWTDGICGGCDEDGGHSSSLIYTNVVLLSIGEELEDPDHNWVINLATEIGFELGGKEGVSRKRGVLFNFLYEER